MMAAPTYPTNDDEIDPGLATYLYEHHCAILIIEDLPTGSQLGIDLARFHIGEKFKGIKLIPPGVHFVYACSQERTTNHFGPRVGFYHNFQTKEILVKKWSVQNEEFDETFALSDDHVQRYLSNLKDLDRYLGPYPFSLYEVYLKLTDRMNPDLVEKIQPECSIIRSVPFLIRDSDQEHHETRRLVNRDSLSEHENLLPELTQARETIFRFTKIPQNHSDSGLKLSAKAITTYHLDTSMKLEHVFIGEEGRERLLVEFQFAFMTLLLGHVFECLERWIDLLNLVCKADAAISRYPKFFESFIDVLRQQLNFIPDDLFIDVDSSKNVIRSGIETLIRNASQNELRDASLTSKLKALKIQVEDIFGWQINPSEDTEDDELPVIVSL